MKDGEPMKRPNRLSSDFFLPNKRPASFFLTPQYRVDVSWLNGTGPEVKTEAPPTAKTPNQAPAPFVDLRGLEGLLRQPDPKIVLSLPKDAELIDQLHKLIRKMPKFAQFNSLPAAPTPAPCAKAKEVNEQSALNADPPTAAPTMDLCDPTSGRRRRHASAE